MEIIMALALGYIAYMLSVSFSEKVFKDNLILRANLTEIEGLGVKKKAKGTEKRQGIDLGFLRISGDMRKKVALSGLDIKPEEFVFIWFFIAFLPTVLVFTFSQSIISSISIMLIGAVLPPLYLNMAINKRRKRFEEQLGDALLLISNGLRAGFSFEQALSNMANNMADPVGTEFAAAVKEMQLGADIEDSMEAIAERMNSEDVKLLTVAVVIQRRVGGNLSEIMETIAKTIRDRLSIARSVSTLTAQGKMSGIVVGLLPVALILVISVISPGYMRPIFTTLPGIMLLIFVCLLELAALVVIRNIIKDIRL